VVFDTNVLVSATLSKSVTSPTRELFERWQRDEFALLTCDALLDELSEKLIEHSIPPVDVALLIATLTVLAEWVAVPEDAITRILPDPDDDVVLACAVLGRADYLITYDPHFDVLRGAYRGVKIARALPFLWALRAQQADSN
jgi:putative PIN family toxin of toxin-antitoxin system